MSARRRIGWAAAGARRATPRSGAARQIVDAGRPTMLANASGPRPVRRRNSTTHPDMPVVVSASGRVFFGAWGSSNCCFTNANVWSLDPATGDFQQLLPTNGHYAETRQLFVSPDGKRFGAVIRLGDGDGSQTTLFTGAAPR